MKSYQFLLSLTAALPLQARGMPARQKGSATIPADYGHYATYVFPADNASFPLYVQGHDGEAKVVTLDLSTFQVESKWQQKHFKTMRMDNHAIEDRDVCEAIAVCYQQAAETATTASLWLANTVGNTCKNIGSSIWHYFSDNNYENLHSILQQAAVGLAINIASTPLGNVILNSGHQATSGQDKCGTREPENLANDFASALQQFCEAIQKSKDTVTDNHYYSGELKDDESSQDGTMAITKAFIASQAGNFGPACKALGIEWKRSLRALSNMLQ
ncbi:hypothetical protein LMH87_000807 [Akanthomyces muscarius]|uniref:Uncharacterized protein n=1 Tax=Akanthomyces muscarius TaxID=2231603 RepID=A0A9W8UP16_AKAMU|nr:hypothetical protein LMH87_000807 [Akanthomyces muscarius]KAJ4155569.1 hypothetical protein LMH87_000807 [Akanthomyces muscarius]